MFSSRYKFKFSFFLDPFLSAVRVLGGHELLCWKSAALFHLFIKSTKRLVDSMADIVIRYNFNQVSLKMVAVFYVIEFFYLTWVFSSMTSMDENAWIINMYFGIAYLILFYLFGECDFAICTIVTC